MPLHSILIVAGLTALVAYMDAQGFLYASRIWGEGGLGLGAALRSGLCFLIGIPTYWLILRYLNVHGIRVAEIQAAIWFLATMVGLALLNGKFFTWTRIDQAVAMAVLAGLTWLVVRVEG